MREWPPFRRAATAEVVVGYADTDAQGRVYYGSYTRFLDTARIHLWSVAGYDDAGVRRLEHATVNARLEIDYHGAAEFHDRLLVDAGIESLGRTSVVVRFAMRRVDGAAVLDARQVAVQVDLAAGGRPVPWSAGDRERLSLVLGAA